MDFDVSFQRRVEFNFFHISLDDTEDSAALVYLENSQGLYYEGFEFVYEGLLLTVYYRSDDQWNTTIFVVTDNGNHFMATLPFLQATNIKDDNARYFLNYYSSHTPLLAKLVINTIEKKYEALHYERIVNPEDKQAYDTFAIRIKNEKPYQSIDEYLLDKGFAFLSMCYKAYLELLKLPDLFDTIEKEKDEDKKLLTKSIIKNCAKLGLCALGIPTIPSFADIMKYKQKRPY